MREVTVVDARHGEHADEIKRDGHRDETPVGAANEGIDGSAMDQSDADCIEPLPGRPLGRS